jgi:ribonuclease HI
MTYRWTCLYNTYIGDGEDVPPDTLGILCYTDGFGRYEGSGSGLAVNENGNPKPTFCTAEYIGTATVFQSEVRAISMACEYVALRQPTQVTILSDSQAAIMAITNPLLTSQTVTQTVDAMKLISRKGHNVLLRWVRGHNGAQGNKMADYQANHGAASRPDGPKPFLPFSNAVIKMAAREDLQYNWSDKWQQRKKGCLSDQNFLSIAHHGSLKKHPKPKSQDPRNATYAFYGV